MTLVATRKTRLGDLLKMEFGLDHGYERKVMDLTLPVGGGEIGQVYAADGTITVAADVASLQTDGTTPLYILIDDNVYTGIYLDPDYPEYVVLSGGPGGSGAAVIVREQLKFGDSLTSNQIDTVVSVIESQGIKVGNQY